MNKRGDARFLYFWLFVFGILGVVLVFASIPQWKSGAATINYSVSEDTPYYHNLSNNITGFNNDVSFAIDTDQNIIWTNTSGTYNVTKDDVSGWISILDSATGNLSINATYDNQTGFFEIPIQATNSTTPGDASTTNFEFVINATNDAPNFININLIYNLTQNLEFFEYINATDEEEHYPLIFNISFYSNCTHAGWSGRNVGENCSLFDFGFNLTNIINTSASMNFTPVGNDVGVYWANISVSDAATNYICTSGYCEQEYNTTNKTSENYLVKFNIFSALTINISNCSGMVFQENQTGTCNITIRTRGEQDELNISSKALLRNYAQGQGDVSNESWFYANQSTSATNFLKTITVNVTPQKTEIGNWTINFTVEDLASDESNTTQIYVYVNRTIDSSPFLDEINNYTIYENKTIYVNASDDDLLIPDKNSDLGGYNETLTFASNTSWVNISSYSSSGNYTTAKIEIDWNTASVSGEGNYTVRVNVTDTADNYAERNFTIEILEDTAPEWNVTNYTFVIYEDNDTFIIYENGINLNNNTFINLSEYVSDSEEDAITFSYVNSSGSDIFNATTFNSTTGIINFTPIDEDVGYHNITVNASDGKLDSFKSFNFTIYNVNDAPGIVTPITVENATRDLNSNINVTEDNYITITLFIDDDDFRIPSGQKSFYNENLTINLTIEGPNTGLFSFVYDSILPSPPNRVKYLANFTPGKSDVGGYNVTINITDNGNVTMGGMGSDFLAFNLTIFEVLHPPTLMSLENKTSAVNRTLYYDINATDTEDGSDAEGGLTFKVSFLFGTDFINDNETIFNTTSGVLNITFNSSQGGKYHINITVNDSDGDEDSDDFWLFVYGLPNVTFPLSDYNFIGLQENVNSNLTFRVNHSVGDNLTYLFYIDNIVYTNSTAFGYTDKSLRYNLSYYGNATNLTWSFTPNFTDESYGKNKNLTLIVYPASSELENASDLNVTINWNLNITHVNAPVNFSGYIGDKGPVSYGTAIAIDLTDYFSDVDYSDSYYSQNVGFTVLSDGTTIGYSFSGWTITFSSGAAVTELISISAYDTNLTNNSQRLTNDESNQFEIEFIEPSRVIVPVPTSGGGGTTPVSLKIIMPDPISAYKKERITIPITLSNTGKRTLSGINLAAIVAKDNLIRKDILVSFDKSYFSSLGVGKKENVTLTIDINTEDLGLYEITVNASVRSPKYNDWGKLYLTVKESNRTEIVETMIFIEEFIAENPECIELKEIIDEAKDFLNRGDYSLALEKSEQAINACKYAISQQSLPRIREKLEDKFYRYLTVFSIALFALGISYYSYKKIRLRRSVLK